MAAIDELTLSHNEMKVALLTKLHAATKAIERIDKASENGFHHYKYASIEDIVAGTREHLLDHGLLILAGQSETSERERQTREGMSVVTTVELTFSIFDIETGYSIELAWIGRGDDPADKGVAKALTDARKTFLVQQLNIARGDDTEADTATDERTGFRSVSGTVNMVADAKGLSDAQLNRALVTLGLPAEKKPFGAFTRIPAELEDGMRTELLGIRGEG